MRLVEPELRELMTEQIRVQLVQRHANGEPVRGGDGEPVPQAREYLCMCRRTSRATLRYQAEGNTVLTATKLILDRSLGVTTDDKVTLADGTSPQIIATETKTDEFGPYYDIVWLP